MTILLPNLSATLRRHGIELHTTVPNALKRRAASELGITPAAFDLHIAALKRQERIEAKLKRDQQQMHTERTKVTRADVLAALHQHHWTLEDILTKERAAYLAECFGVTVPCIKSHIRELRADARRTASEAMMRDAEANTPTVDMNPIEFNAAHPVTLSLGPQGMALEAADVAEDEASEWREAAEVAASFRDGYRQERDAARAEADDLRRNLNEALTANENLQRQNEHLRSEFRRLVHERDDYYKASEGYLEQRDWLLAEIQSRIAAHTDQFQRTDLPSWYKPGVFNDTSKPELTEDQRTAAFRIVRFSDDTWDFDFQELASVLQLAADLAALAASR